MSLDVSLTRKYHVSYDGGTTLEEREEQVFEANITHNLNAMAAEANIYDVCWHPYSINAEKAKDIIPILEKGYADLKAKPEYFDKFSAPNGWGVYKDFLPWVERYLTACKKYPEAKIHTRT